MTNEKRLSLDDHAKIVAAHWKYPNKYKAKLLVTDMGHGHYFIGWDKTSRQILKEIQDDEARQIQNQARSAFKNIKQIISSIFRYFK